MRFGSFDAWKSLTRGSTPPGPGDRGTTRRSVAQARSRIRQAQPGWEPSCRGRRTASAAMLRRTRERGRRPAVASSRGHGADDGCVDWREAVSPLPGSDAVKFADGSSTTVERQSTGMRATLAPASRMRVTAKPRTAAASLTSSAPSEMPRVRPDCGNGPYSSARFCASASTWAVALPGPPAGGSTP